MDDVAPRRIRFSTMLTSFAVVVAFSWSGHYLYRCGEVFAQVKVPMPGMFVLLTSIPPLLWYAATLAAGLVLCAKDLWFEEKRARFIDALAIPAAFLFYLLVEFTVKMPFLSLMEGIGGRR